uniref:Uncharacterized protein n=1 Tax=Erwinia amylovora ATCC BAA-2158 TaxID=889211 RepID=E5B6R4_ERWAM|nr:hypothetical protein predicted by Glimmer/Critica [Erwinia amylovora ATCC BAA-2158]
MLIQSHRAGVGNDGLRQLTVSKKNLFAGSFCHIDFTGTDLQGKLSSGLSARLPLNDCGANIPLDQQLFT